MHILEAGFDAGERPCVLLLHGFPELAYSWRRIMPALADAGFHVVAPDLRGYGRTTGWHADYDSEADLQLVPSVECGARSAWADARARAPLGRRGGGA